MGGFVLHDGTLEDDLRDIDADFCKLVGIGENIRVLYSDKTYRIWVKQNMPMLRAIENRLKTFVINSVAQMLGEDTNKYTKRRFENGLRIIYLSKMTKSLK